MGTPTDVVREKRSPNFRWIVMNCKNRIIKEADVVLIGAGVMSASLDLFEQIEERYAGHDPRRILSCKFGICDCCLKLALFDKAKEALEAAIKHAPSHNEIYCDCVAKLIVRAGSTNSKLLKGGSTRGSKNLRRRIAARSIQEPTLKPQQLPLWIKRGQCRQ
ncbi:MAG: malate:quinone oxidoreductase [Candidatus Obscuribacterales bacterium]|nr:malate:quinone oxidoreductase [Candidatus Obscuribacterales bacterium]